ncbi:NFkB inhibitor [Murmansk poxvirus]|uniref:Early protein OPG038 n=1 Tax=Murmansk poxvirus TaxID=2025359 RepID=A0A223FN35_9POXV|nr:NFkB inhibitor [Murmansk poxvirus]AST09387.1 NFkB inhibitor [Murmansk poxvirus]
MNSILLLICLLSVGYAVENTYKPLQCPAKNPRYWYLAAEITIGLDYNVISTIPGECHMVDSYVNRNAMIVLTGYGLEIKMTINDTDQKFVGAAEGIAKNNKLSILLFTTQRLDHVQHNISLTITCLEYNCGTVRYKDMLSEAMKHITDCDITINGNCIKCVNLYMDPIDPGFHHQGKYIIFNNDYDKRGSYGITFENQNPLEDCFIKLDDINYDICYRESI